MSASVRSGPISAVRTRPCRSTRSCRPPGRARRGSPAGSRSASARRRRSSRVGGRLDCLVGRPGIADGVLPHDPPLAFVVEAVRGRRRRLVPRRPAGRTPRAAGREPDDRSALHDASTTRVGAEAGECARASEDSAARTRLGARHDVAREVAERRDASSCRRCSRPRRVAPRPRRGSRGRTRRGSSARSRRCPSPADAARSTRSTHQPGPVGNSHW